MEKPSLHQGAANGGRHAQSFEVSVGNGGAYLKVRLMAHIHKEDGGYAVYCPALDVASQGDTVDEAKKNIAEATLCFLKGCRKRGTLKKVLLESVFLPAMDGKQVPKVPAISSAGNSPKWFPFSTRLAPVANHRRVKHAA